MIGYLQASPFIYFDQIEIADVQISPSTASSHSCFQQVQGLHSCKISFFI